MRWGEEGNHTLGMRTFPTSFGTACFSFEIPRVLYVLLTGPTPESQAIGLHKK